MKVPRRMRRVRCAMAERIGNNDGPGVVVEMMLGGPDVIVSEIFRQHGFLKMLVVDLGYRAMPLRKVAKGQKNSKVHERGLLD